MDVEADDLNLPTGKREEAFFLEDRDVVHSTCEVCRAVFHTAVR